MKKLVRRIINRGVGISISATALTAGVVAVLHWLKTPQPLKSTLPGDARLYVWHKRSIFYKVLGAEDAPPLVLLHTPDIGASAREMQQIMEPLAQTYRVYAPDLLGFGLSDRPRMAYSAQMYSELCRDFLHEVVAQPTTLVASGLSCNYAVAVAAQEAEWCTGLVLISPLVLHGDPEQPRILQALAELPFFKLLLYPLLSTRLAFLLTSMHASEQTDFAHFYATTHQLGAQHATMALVSGKLVQDISREFEALRQPVLLIWGTKALEDQRNLASLHSTSQLRRVREVELIQGAGLAAHEEQPERVVAAIQSWQAKCFGTQLPTVAISHGPSVASVVQPTVCTPSDVVHVAYAQLERANELVLPVEDVSNVSTDVKPREPVAQHEYSTSEVVIQGYCVKCKTKNTMLQTSEFTTKNGRAAIRGTCAVCGAAITRLGGFRTPEER